MRLKVMKVLLRNHGMNLMGVKSNLYTSIGERYMFIALVMLIDRSSRYRQQASQRDFVDGQYFSVLYLSCPATDV